MQLTSWYKQTLLAVNVVWFLRSNFNGPLARYVNLRVVHAPGMPGTFSPSPRVSDPYKHHGTCVAHVSWCMSGSLTRGFLLIQWRGKHSRHPRRMRKPQFYVLGKRPIVWTSTSWTTGHPLLGFCSLSDKTSYHQSSLRPEATRLDVIMVTSLLNLTGISAAGKSNAWGSYAWANEWTPSIYSCFFIDGWISLKVQIWSFWWTTV